MKSKTLKNIANCCFGTALLMGTCAIGSCAMGLDYSETIKYAEKCSKNKIEKRYTSLQDKIKNDNFAWLPEKSRDLYIKGLKTELEAMSQAKKTLPARDQSRT